VKIFDKSFYQRVFDVNHKKFSSLSQFKRFARLRENETCPRIGVVD